MKKRLHRRNECAKHGSKTAANHSLVSLKDSDFKLFPLFRTSSHVGSSDTMHRSSWRSYLTALLLITGISFFTGEKMLLGSDLSSQEGQLKVEDLKKEQNKDKGTAETKKQAPIKSKDYRPKMRFSEKYSSEDEKSEVFKDAKTSVGSVKGKVASIQRNMVAVEFTTDPEGHYSEERLLPIDKNTKLLNVGSFSDIRPGDLVSVKFKEIFNEKNKEKFILKTLATEIMVLKSEKNKERLTV